MFNDRRRSFAPIKVGDEIDVSIEAKGAQGDGIAKVKGFVVFVPNTKQGDNVRVKITKVFKKVGFGEVVGESSGSSTESNEESSEETEEQSDNETSEEMDNDSDEDDIEEESVEEDEE